MTVPKSPSNELPSGHIWPVSEPWGSANARHRDYRFVSRRTIARVERTFKRAKHKKFTDVCRSRSCPKAINLEPHVHTYDVHKQIVDGSIEVFEKDFHVPSYEWLRAWSGVSLTIFGARCWKLLGKDDPKVSDEDYEQGATKLIQDTLVRPSQVGLVGREETLLQVGQGPSTYDDVTIVNVESSELPED